MILTLRTRRLKKLSFHPLKIVSRYRDPQLQVTENLCYLKFKSQHISVFQDWKHIRFLSVNYTGANKYAELLSTVVDISVIRVTFKIFNEMGKFLFFEQEK